MWADVRDEQRHYRQRELLLGSYELRLKMMQEGRRCRALHSSLSIGASGGRLLSAAARAA